VASSGDRDDYADIDSDTDAGANPNAAPDHDAIPYTYTVHHSETNAHTDPDANAHRYNDPHRKALAILVAAFLPSALADNQFDDSADFACATWCRRGNRARGATRTDWADWSHHQVEQEIDPHAI